MNITQTRYVSEFVCLGAECEDTCCQGWGMQVDDVTYARYQAQAPELLVDVVEGESDHVMRRDAETDCCVKLQNGLCGIHAKYGTDFLGDACHFYPRITRLVQDSAVMTAALSCPEAARLALFGSKPFEWVDAEITRQPELIRRYEIEGVGVDTMLAIHRALIDAAGDEIVPPERMLARLVSASASLSVLPATSWKDAIPFYYANADARLLPAEADAADPFNLFHVLVALIHAARKSPRMRLRAVVDLLSHQLQTRIDPETLHLLREVESNDAYDRMENFWYSNAALPMVPVLRRYVQAQFSISFFPFSGLGTDMAERLRFIVVRFSIVKLALMALSHQLQDVPNEAQCIEVIQPLSRFLDHLSEPRLSMALFQEAGWAGEPRLRGLIQDQ